MNDLNANLQNVNSRIARACRKAGRAVKNVRLLAVSKRQAADKIRLLHAAGQKDFGENYVQEAREKQEQLGELGITWHFIGPLQSNKTREVAEHFDWVQSVDREKLLLRLSGQRPEHLPALNVCLQVNIDREPQKSGVLPEDLPQLAQAASRLPGLRLRGLMAIPKLTHSATEAMQSFENMHSLFTRLRSDGLALDILSMGMSSDLEQAIFAGSTMVRIGTDLFGPRDGV